MSCTCSLRGIFFWLQQAWRADSPAARELVAISGDALGLRQHTSLVTSPMATDDPHDETWRVKQYRHPELDRKRDP